MESQAVSLVLAAWTVGIPILGFIVKGLLNQNNEKLMDRLDERFVRKDIHEEQIEGIENRVGRIEGKVWGGRP